MSEEIKEILDRLEKIDNKEYSCGFEFADSGSFDEDCRCFEERKKMANYITNLQQKVEQLESRNKEIYDGFKATTDELCESTERVEQLEKENNDLRRIYQNTYKKYFENGNEEMAHYFMAQIDACPTFYVEPIIDYYKEYHKLENIRKEAIEYLKKREYDNYSCSVCSVMSDDLLNILNKGSDNHV